MLVSEFDFDLPKELIANFPVVPRDHAKLMVYDRRSEIIKDSYFYDLAEILGENDVLIMNNTKVIPARYRTNKYFKGEILFIEQKNGLWKVMVRPGKKFRIGDNWQFDSLNLTVEHVDESGFRYIRVNKDKEELMKFLWEKGEMPVPPYISGNSFLESDYNTVFSQKEESIAAPTAGLHFTDELIRKLEEKGVKIEFVSLAVGLGTFMPVKVSDTKDHVMHEEKYEIKEETAERINSYIKIGKRIITVGTTSIRVMEDNYARFGEIRSGQFSTDIFIQPGYEWKVVQGIITNFHLPKSTLIMLVSAFIGTEKTMQLYKQAISKHYRFYSFGDGMLLL